MSACRSEKPSTRSGSSSRILSVLAERNAARPRFLAARAGGPHGVARDADDAALLAQQVQSLGRLLGEADDALGGSTPFGTPLIPRTFRDRGEDAVARAKKPLTPDD